MIGRGFLNRAARMNASKLGLVADFSEGDDAGRDEERFHIGPQGKRTMFCSSRTPG